MERMRLSAVEWYILLVALVMTIGGIVSIALTSNPDWMNLHLSRLGEGGNLSSYIFNATAAFSGMAILGLSAQIMQAKGWSTIDKTLAVTLKRILRTAFRAIAVCLVGLAIFPYDRFVAVHNTFGYGMTMIFLAVVSYVSYASPFLTKKFTLMTNIFLAVIVGLFILYFVFNGRQINLLQIQFLGLLFFFTWIYKLAEGLRNPLPL